MPYETARRLTGLVAALLFVFVLAIPAGAFAQSSYQVRFAKAENAIRTHEPTINWWEQQSRISLGLGLTIVALGIATGVLQALTRPWTKPATLVVGALVTAMTAINTTYFEADYRTLMNRAREGRTLIRLADKFIVLAPSLPTDSDREEALGYIQESAEALALLVGGGSKGRPVADTDASTSFDFPSPFATLFAAGGECGCASLGRQDTSAYRYFCGQGTSKSLGEARMAATEEALSQASMQLRKESKSAGGDLTSYLRRVSSEVAACPVSGARGFTMFVLLRVPTTLTTEGAQQAFVKPLSVRSRVRVRLDSIRVVRDGSPGFAGWTFDIRANGKVFSLPNRNYSDRPTQDQFFPAAVDNALLEIDNDGTSPVRIEVFGRRSIGGDTVSGTHLISPEAQGATVSVRNATSANKGWFEFTFSAITVR